jgi:hypothetical protein
MMVAIWKANSRNVRVAGRGMWNRAEDMAARASPGSCSDGSPVIAIARSYAN